jgi:hypothetical protein
MPFLSLLRFAAPYAAIALAIVLVWFHGYHTADARRIAYEAQIAAQSNVEIAQAAKRNADANAQLTEAAKIIGSVYDVNHQKISKLGADNHRLLAGRLRADAGCSVRTVSEDPSATGNSDASTADAWVVQRPVADRLIDRQADADEVIETARACQNYVKQIEQVINETRN